MFVTNIWIEILYLYIFEMQRGYNNICFDYCLLALDAIWVFRQRDSAQLRTATF